MTNTVPKYADIVIRNGTLIDGTGAPRVQADVAIAGDSIVAVGSLPSIEAKVEINAAGLIIAPGFIDVHTHDDRLLLSSPDMLPKVTQGVTTVIVGNCGISLAPLVLSDRPPPPLNLLGNSDWYRFPTFAAYIQALEASPPAVNAALLVGHSTLRVRAMSDITRPANAQEIAVMQECLAEALSSGAIGFSTGLSYPTSRAATKEEVIALLELLRPVGGIYTTHLRSESDGIEAALEETFETARCAGVQVVISHHKCAGIRNWGRSQQTLKRIEQVRLCQPVGLDVYPYTASSTVLLPDIKDEGLRIIVAWSEAEPALAGRDLADIAQIWNCTLKEAVHRLQPAGAIYFEMDEADVRRILAYPHTMIGSDGLPHDKHPHPRLWGTFPRVLGYYARELGLLTLEDAIRRMTSLPAMQFQLKNRGVLRPGAYADIVMFDADNVIDCATFSEPKKPANGIQLVMVNGVIIYQDRSNTCAKPGRILRTR